MTYTIGEVAEKTNISAFTLRYYDKEGLLPFLEKTKKGTRYFKDSDLALLDVIECLKSSGMSLKDIKNFIHWTTEGDSTLQQRHDMFAERKIMVEQKLAEYQKILNKLNFKCWYYKTAIEAGTSEIHNNLIIGQSVPEFNPEEHKS
jgi:DNA-binding transcriptional MerR regulator